jgi:hypothetical protein
MKAELGRLVNELRLSGKFALNPEKANKLPEPSAEVWFPKNSSEVGLRMESPLKESWPVPSVSA